MKIEKLLNIPNDPEPDAIYFIKKNENVDTVFTGLTSDLYQFTVNSDINIKGPVELEIDSTGVYEITDYDSRTTYNIQAIDGSIISNLDPLTNTFSYTAPSQDGVSGFTINGKTFTVNIVQPALVNTSPMMAGYSFGIMSRYFSTEPAPANEYGRGSLITSNNKIINFGTTEDQDGYVDNIFINRLDTDFFNDNTFATDSIFKINLRDVGVTDLQTAPGIINVHELTDGKLLVIAVGVVHENTYSVDLPTLTTFKLDTSGQLDNTFGINYYPFLGTDVFVDAPSIFHIASFSNSVKDSNDCIYITGSLYNGSITQPFVLKLDETGILDTSFGVDGICVINSGGAESYGLQSAIDSNNDLILLASEINTSSTFSIALYKVLETGVEDTVSFNKYSLPTTPSEELFYGSYLALNSTDEIFVGGSYSDNYALAVIKFDTDGTFLTDYISNRPSIGFCTNIITEGNDVYTCGLLYNYSTSSETTITTKLNTNLIVDETFGNNGHYLKAIEVTTTPLTLNLVDSSNKLLITTDNLDLFNNRKMGFIKLLKSNGKLDSTFNETNFSFNSIKLIYRPSLPVKLLESAYITDTELDSIVNYNNTSFSVVRHGGINLYDKFSIYTEDSNFYIRNDKAIINNTTNEVIGSVSENVNNNETTGSLTMTFTTNNKQDVIDVIKNILYTNTSADVLSFTDLNNYKLDIVFDDGNTGSQGSGGSLSFDLELDVYAAPGTLLDEYCDGTTKKQDYADGYGGLTTSVVETNSLDCGYVVPANTAPYITTDRLITGYVPGEPILLFPDAALVDDEMAQVTNIVDNLPGVYNGMTVHAVKQSGSSVNDKFTLVPIQGENTGTYSSGSTIYSPIQSTPNLAIGTVNSSSRLVSGALIYEQVQTHEAAFNLGASQVGMNDYIKALSYSYTGSGTPSFNIAVTVNDHNNGTQGTGGALQSTTVISLIASSHFINDEFTDTNGVTIDAHSPIQGSVWLNSDDYVINNNKLYRESTANSDVDTALVYSGSGFPSENNQTILLFNIEDMSASIEVGLILRLKLFPSLDYIKVACVINSDNSYSGSIRSKNNSGTTFSGGGGAFDTFAAIQQHKLSAMIIGNVVVVYLDELLIAAHRFNTSANAIPTGYGKTGFYLLDNSSLANNIDSIRVYDLY